MINYQFILASFLSNDTEMKNEEKEVKAVPQEKKESAKKMKKGCQSLKGIHEAEELKDPLTPY